LLHLESWFLGRHELDVVLSGDGLDEPARAALAGHDRRPGVAAHKRTRRGVEAQAGALLLDAVTGVAMPRQDRFDVAQVINSRIRRPPRHSPGQHGEEGKPGSHDRPRVPRGEENKAGQIVTIPYRTGWWQRDSRQVRATLPWT